MLKPRNRTLGMGLGSATLLAASTAFAAAPDTWWDHVEFAGNHAACVAQAETVMSGKIKGNAKKGEDNVVARDEETVAVIECLPMGDKMVAMVLVSSSNVESGNQVFESLKRGMAKQ